MSEKKSFLTVLQVIKESDDSAKSVGPGRQTRQHWIQERYMEMHVFEELCQVKGDGARRAAFPWPRTGRWLQPSHRSWLVLVPAFLLQAG